MHLQVLLLACSPFSPSVLCNALLGCAIALDAELRFGTCPLAHASSTMHTEGTNFNEDVGLLHVYIAFEARLAGLLFVAAELQESR